MTSPVILASGNLLELSIRDEGPKGNEGGNEEVGSKVSRPLEATHAQGKEDAVGDEQNPVGHPGYLHCDGRIVKIFERHSDTQEEQVGHAFDVSENSQELDHWVTEVIQSNKGKFSFGVASRRTKVCRTFSREPIPT